MLLGPAEVEGRLLGGGGTDIAAARAMDTDKLGLFCERSGISDPLRIAGCAHSAYGRPC